MLNSVFSDLCVDYGPGNDTVVLRSPVKPGMTMFEYVCCKSVNRYITTIFCSDASFSVSFTIYDDI